MTANATRAFDSSQELTMSLSTFRQLGAVAAGLSLACAALLPTAAQADGRRALHGPRVVAPVPPYLVGPGPGHYRGGGHWHGPGWGGVALGLGLGALIVARPWEPVIVERPTYIYADPPPPAPPAAPPQGTPVPSRHADPVIYPSQGQSPEQTEADRQACNRWATTQPAAMADASVFQRATLACLEGRGYTVR
jgi:hypothetical protein